jgi:peptidoglycan/LPS O-acetylase OafA/YrhL
VDRRAVAANEPARERSRFYFPELDGLRFLAFLLVFVHHAPELPHPVFRFVKELGWIGVDLFFALSAFLFVKLLAKEFDLTGTIGIRNFYIRRGLRIWPIYFVYCLAMMALSSVLGLVDFFSWRGLGLLTFTDNILSACQGFNDIHYTAHLWTISYEEQFYVVIPLVLLVFFRSSRLRIALSLAACAVAFVAARAWFIGAHVPHPAVWTLPVTHFESILLGIVVGLGGFGAVLSRVPAALVLATALLTGWVVARLGSVSVVDWKLMAVYPLIGLCTSLTVYFVSRTGRARCMRWLSFGPLVYLGKVSYGLYVYHVLALSISERLVGRLTFLHSASLPLRSSIVFFVGLGIVMTMAAASYHFIEKPFLKLKKRFEVIPSRPA